jgi:nucleotide-binding universal stress UspA family protein
VARDLALELLRFSRALADTCSGELEVISCWDYEIEGALRDSAFIRMPEAEVASLVAKAERDHRAVLDAVVHESAIGGNVRIHHVRGRADRTIPGIVSASGVDILVMGTVARTGLPGFIMGNTAENILQGIACSVVAMKPHGFVSPVSAY